MPGLLFDQWGIGHEKLGDTTWNTGILLLVSKGDRKARIELGAGWGREQDQLCRQIMDEYIVPKFKEGNFSGGIVLGVESLAKMAQGLKLPTRPRPWWHYALVLGAVGLGIFTVISLVRRGSSGWAWLLWARCSPSSASFSTSCCRPPPAEAVGSPADRSAADPPVVAAQADPGEVMTSAEPRRYDRVRGL